MEWIKKLIPLLPIITQIAGSGPTAQAIAKLIQLAEQEIERRMNETGKTREQVLEEGRAAWEEAGMDVEILKNLGH